MAHTGIFLINNTNTDIVDMFRAEIIKAIEAGGVLPEELADLITLTPVTVDGAVRWRIDAA